MPNIHTTNRGAINLDIVATITREGKSLIFSNIENLNIFKITHATEGDAIHDLQQIVKIWKGDEND